MSEEIPLSKEEEEKQRIEQKIREEQQKTKLKVWLSEKEVSELCQIILSHPDVETYLKVKRGEAMIAAHDNLVKGYHDAVERRKRLPAEVNNPWNHPKMIKENLKKKEQPEKPLMYDITDSDDWNAPPAEIADVEEDLLGEE